MAAFRMATQQTARSKVTLRNLAEDSDVIKFCVSFVLVCFFLLLSGLLDRVDLNSGAPKIMTRDFIVIPVGNFSGSIEFGELCFW